MKFVWLLLLISWLLTPLQFRVPKYLERESTIAFGLTFKKLAILGGLGLLLFLLYYVLPKIVWGFLAVLTAGLFFIFNFVKPGGQGIFHILTRSFNYVFSQRLYFWQKKEGLRPIKMIMKKKESESHKRGPLRLAPHSRLHEVHSKIDLGES